MVRDVTMMLSPGQHSGTDWEVLGVTPNLAVWALGKGRTTLRIQGRVE